MGGIVRLVYYKLLVVIYKYFVSLHTKIVEKMVKTKRVVDFLKMDKNIFVQNWKIRNYLFLKKYFLKILNFYKTRCITRDKFEKSRNSKNFKNFKNFKNGPPKTFCNHLCKNSKILIQKSMKKSLQILEPILYTKFFTQIIEVCQNFFGVFRPSIF